MLAAIKRSEAAAVVVYKLDRLSRSQKDTLGAVPGRGVLLDRHQPHGRAGQHVPQQFRQTLGSPEVYSVNCGLRACLISQRVRIGEIAEHSNHLTVSYDPIRLSDARAYAK